MDLACNLALLLCVSALAADPEPVKTATGLLVTTLKAGQAGTMPKPGDTVTVHYVGTFEDGAKFDSSRDRGEPFSFQLGVGQVIKGWDEGVALMSVGGTYRLNVPWALAYGETGRGKIPAKANLVFEVELLGVEPGEPLPVFGKPDAAKQQTTASGLKYEVLEAGRGDSVKPGQGLTARFALWNAAGELVICSATGGGPMRGLPADLRIGPLPLKFMPEALALLKPGCRYRFEVPPALAWGDKAVHPLLPANSTSVWELDLDAVNDVPAFAQSPADKLQKTASGLGWEILKPGAGDQPVAGSQVTVRYTGWLADGKIFDSSHARGETVDFGVDQVIPGFKEGLLLMQPGGTYRLTIPADLAYGDTPPQGSDIPAGATLVFLVELVKVAK